MFTEDRFEPGTIKKILDACTLALEPETPARWKFSLRNGVDLGGVAHYDADWLSLTIPAATRSLSDDPGLFRPISSPAGMADTGRAAGACHLLALNGKLPGGVRFARVGHGMTLVILGELPLDRDIDLARRVPEVCRGLKVAAEAHALTFRESAPRPPETTLAFVREKLLASEPTATGGAEPLDQAAMLELCAEAGWQATGRGEDRGVVELDVPGGGRQAILSGIGGGGLRVVTELGACAATAADPCRVALAVLLLRTCGIVRMVRAAVEITPNRLVPRFEVCFDSAPGSIEIAHALAALSIACRVAAEEAEALREDERLARIYLATLDGDVETTGGRERARRKRKAKRVSQTKNWKSLRAEGSITQQEEARDGKQRNDGIDGDPGQRRLGSAPLLLGRRVR